MKKTVLAIALVVTMLLTCAVSALAVEEASKIEGDLTVTTFFNEKTDAVPLKSGDSYTFQFKNTSNGTNNYENFVMAITGAIGDAYTGADQEVLIIRADNWGWGGRMSDFVDPGQTAGNVLKFETDIVWENWVAEAQAGMDVKITISRDGDTLTYDATIGGHYVKTTATSGVALPETCYVFFTGENCVLSGIKTVAAPNAPKDEVPKTGDESDLAVWVALMAVSALGLAAVVITKKTALKRCGK